MHSNVLGLVTQIEIVVGDLLHLVFTVESEDHCKVFENIQEFWQSWHISLTGWVREYVYMSVVATSRNRDTR